MIKSICIVRLSALGDVLMLVPLVRTIQAYYPQVRLTWIISLPAYELVKGLDGVEFIVIEKPKHVGDYWQFYQQMKHQTFDVLLAAQASMRANLLYPCIRAKRKIGYDKLRAKDAHLWFVHESIQPGHDHTLEGFLRFADAIGIEQKVIRWDLPIQESEIIKARSLLPQTSSRIMLVNPAASKPERSWLPERYVEVIRHVQSKWNVTVVLIGGPGQHDKELGEKIAANTNVLNVIGKTRLKELLALIQQADLLLCPDTGPSHMGAAVSTPVVALHAVTSSSVSGPYIYQHLAVDYYPQAVETVLKTTQDANVWGTHAHGVTTMRLVTVDAVIARVDEVLGADMSSG